MVNLFPFIIPIPRRMLVVSWWRHQRETFSALLAICAGNSPVPGEFLTQRPVTRSFDVFFDVRLNKRLSKQSWGWWFETLSRPLLRHRNVCFQILTNVPATPARTEPTARIGSGPTLVYVIRVLSVSIARQVRPHHVQCIPKICTRKQASSLLARRLGMVLCLSSNPFRQQ